MKCNGILYIMCDIYIVCICNINHICLHFENCMYNIHTCVCHKMYSYTTYLI